MNGDTGAPVDLWDTAWPESGYYWTVVPVALSNPGGTSTTVASPGAKLGDSTLPVASSTGIGVGDTITVGSNANAETVTVTAVSGATLTLASQLAYGHGPGEPVQTGGGKLDYRDLELPQDACGSGRVARFGKDSQVSLTASNGAFVTGLSWRGRLTSALHDTRFYGEPLVAWTPALGASVYEVQWSKTRYPFVAQIFSGLKGLMTFGTSVVLPVKPGTWWYRVRGFDYSLPTGAQQMTWSDPIRIVVAKPTFRIVRNGTPAKPKAKSKPKHTRSN
jgi:hypothetical protein